MIVLRIEHPIPNFQGWKNAFETDPINRKKSGVRSYRIFRPVDNSNYVIVDLEFASLQEAEDTLYALRKLWEKVEGKIMTDPQTRILDLIESQEV